MRKIFATLVFLTAVGMSPFPALADEIEGVIARIDQNGVLHLKDGTKIALPDDFNVEGLDPGTKVYVDYEVIEGENVALDIEVIE